MATLETTNILNEIKVTNDLSYYNEQLALKHATDAENSANKAKSEADKASASATDVESSANRAKSEADKASASATEAKSTLNSAVTTITNTKNSAISAIQAEGNVQRTSLQGYVDNAKSYANSASASASTATTKASEIVTSANNAKTYMTNAQSYMNTAKTYQDNALSYKNSAQTSASVATEQANLAKQYASSVDKESINISKMYTTGAVSTDTQGYNQLVEMKRSTFDKSKFTITGNPTITDNGVARGFGSGNYLNTGYLLDTTKPWVIYSGKVKFNNATTLQTIWCSSYKNDASSDNNPMQIALNAQGKLRLLLSSVNNYGATTPDIANAIVGNNIFTTNTNYYFKLEFNGNKYTLSYSVDGANYIIDITVNSPSTIASGYVFIGLRLFVGKTDNPILGSIDLSQFSITVDGKEVFSGNKTDIDTIKADNYDVVGSPVISDDGVASGFSNENYLTTPTIDFASANRWKVVSKFRYFASNVTMSVYQFLKGNTNNALYINPSGYIKIYIKTVGNTTVDFSSQTASSSHSAVSLTSGSDVVAELEFTGTQYIFKVYQNGSLIYADTKGSTNAIYPSNTNGLNIGISAFDGYFTTGSIDLNSFKVYVDGNLVYQPCLKIPYTQSKTGSKIVDGVYRDRVQDVYEQFGTASYYTHDETNQNFTLPMGEIYGMIEQIADRLNNPFTFGMNQYYKGEMKNLSWLKSYGQEYFKNGHPDFYNWVLTNANAGKKGFKLSTANDITDYDFVVNPTKETFMLPLKNGMEGVFASGVKGNGKALVVTDGNGNERNLFQPGNDYIFTNDNVAGNLPHVTASYSGNQTTSYALGTNVGLTTDSSKSGIVVDTTVPQGWNLYYYVGETVEGANLIKAGEVWEEISNKLDTPPRYVVEVSDKSLMPSWYVVYNDGWCEQGGLYSFTGSHGATYLINLLKNFSNTDYTILRGGTYAIQTTALIGISVVSKATDNFSIQYASQNGGGYAVDFYWQASGYIK